MITKENFWKNTFAEFKTCEMPEKEPDYISESGSKYWINDDHVIRLSDHWGLIGTCYWDIEIGSIGYCYYPDFEKRPEQDKCIKCGAPIVDSGHIKRVLDMDESPKYCEHCRRELRDYRKKGIVNRREIRRWDNAIFQNFPFIPEMTDNNSQYYIYHFGGRDSGPWGGASHTGKKLIFVSKNWDYNEPALIRLMKKIAYNKENELDINEYLVIDKAQDTSIPTQYVYYYCDYHKTTNKGLGRDRNLRHNISGEYDEVISASSSARSGCFGNFQNIIIGRNVEIEKSGVA